MELAITLREPHKRAELFGTADRHLRRLREAFSVQVSTRSGGIRLSGEPADVGRAAAVLERLQEALVGHDELDAALVDRIFADAEPDLPGSADAIQVFTREPVIAKTEGQRGYVRAMFEHDLTLCTGPAGTGKTFLAVAVAVNLLKTGRAKRIALVRPAVEAGERLGFLPGDLQQKVNPYLRPLLDAMHDMMPYEQLKRFMLNDIVEVIPLAYMRGRTLNHAVIILDEAQNSTPGQMFMFLTRLGHSSKMIVTGDVSQVDLPPDQPSGLSDAIQRLQSCRGVACLRLGETDIFRHRLVQEIVARYAAEPRGAASHHRSDRPSRPGVAPETDPAAV